MGIDVLRVNRIGQISGTTGPGWPMLVDPVGNPLLTDSGAWNMIGVDEGANAEHSDGRLYFFFGDAATNLSGRPPENADPVAWTNEPAPLRHGGHQAMGLNFQLPIAGAGVEGQPDWQFCLKCSTLFWNGDPHFKGCCSLGGTHDTFGVGLNFSLPFEPTNSAGQHQWRFCVKCASLFWEGDPGTTGICPAGATHVAAGWKFVIPVTPGAHGGQQDWRFCVRCHGLFFDGYPGKGICAAAPGGGIHLNVVTQDGAPRGPFDSFRAGEPIGYTGSLETPNGAFSYDRRMYVFAGFTEERYSHRKRPGDPQPGQYLFSKADPSKPGPYDTEFLLSPRLGCCARDSARTVFESHTPLGLHFLLAHDLAPTPGRRSGWRSCRKCEAIYSDGDASFKGVCQRGGSHEPDPAVPEVFSLELGAQEDPQNQSNWRQCRTCLALYWAPDGHDSGLCPASGHHVATDDVFRVPHPSIEPYALGQPDWRFCDKCNALFWNGDGASGICARDGGPHRAAGFNFQVPFTTAEGPHPGQSWRYCIKCASLFFEGGHGVCPKDRGAHQAAGWYFSPSRDRPASLEWQASWCHCGKCGTLYFDGYPDKGRCAVDRQGHVRAAPHAEFQLPHNPGIDAWTRDRLRFCIRCHGLVRTDQAAWAPWTSATVVDNAAHAVLPGRTGSGVVMINFDWRNFSLSWMALEPGLRPRPDSIRYFHAGKRVWSETIDRSAGYELFAQFAENRYTHVSSSWLPGPRCWVVLYGTASDTQDQDRPIMARFSPDLLSWSDAVPVFDPNREHAYGVYMHDPAGSDRIHPNLPPSQPPGQNNKAWAYGAFLIDRYTTWDAGTRVLNLSYLMSPSSPYQVQLMETALHLSDPVVG
jgi:hypothetical protein